MDDKTNIMIHGISINTADRLARISLSSTAQIGNYCRNHRVQGFGEQNSDRTFFHRPLVGIEDSDFVDMHSVKRT